jgi:hypothetical protein
VEHPLEEQAKQAGVGDGFGDYFVGSVNGAAVVIRSTAR